MKLLATTATAVLLLLSTVYSQTKPAKKPALISFNINFSDYNLPRTIKDSGASKAFKGNDWYNPGKKSFGIGVSWIKPLTNKIDFSANLSGTFSNFPSLFVKGDSIGQAGFTPQLDALLHLNMFQPNVSVNPFLTAGVGAGKFGDQFAAYAPLGVGLKFRFHEGAFLTLQTQWRKKLMDGINNDYLFYNIGFTQSTAKKKKEPVAKTEPAAVIPPDKDGDGIEDSKDDCPDVKGTVKGCPDSDGDGVADKDDACPNEKGILNGCPDSDGDGIADKEDKCPDAKGIVNGCPDSDGDGVADKDDKCPDVKGTFSGCPDSDGDGVGDGDDKCPAVAGKAEENGCPEIKQEIIQKVDYAAKNIFFRFGSDVLLNRSLMPLNEVVRLLQKDPALQLVIEAHTDSIGTEERNQELSERRAKRVALYFKNKGIDPKRITVQGYGETRPVADNNTNKGRAKNRRVEMKLRY